MKPNYFRGFIKGIILIQMFILIIVAGVGFDFNRQYLQKLSRPNFNNILIPLLAVGLTNDQASSLIRESNYVLAGNSSLPQIGYFKDKMPQEIMAANIQALAYGENNSENKLPVAAEPEATQEDEPEDKNTVVKNNALFKDHKVVFYCTHSGESYIPDSKKAYLNGQPGLVIRVAAGLSEDIRNKGLNAQFISTLHDYPDYNRSYTRSRDTIKEVVKDKQDVLAVFDVHRDSIPGSKTAPRCTVKGKSCARILIIVGTDQRKEHPHWKTNYQFAQKLYAQAEKMYPGLVKGVITRAGTYNQEFHDHALLLEMGSDYNTFEEARYAGRLFADVLVEVLKEEV